MDTKTVLGYYFSFFNWFQGVAMFCALHALTIGFFISLSIYIDAFSEDFGTTIKEMNAQIEENSKSPRPRNDSSRKLSDAILLHNEMSK